MANYFRKAKSLYSSTTNSFGTGEGETITPASVAGLPTDTEIVLTFDKDVSGKLERILGTISGSNFSISSGGRGYDGTTEQSHTAPAVEYIPNGADINDHVDGILVEHAQTGVHDATKILKIAGAQTVTGAKTFTTGLLKAVDVTSGAGVSTFPTSTDTLVGRATTDTLTNKRITKRVVTATDDATAVIDVAVTDDYQLSAIANDTVFTITGTPTDGQVLIIRYKDAGVAKALTFTGFTALGTTIPTTTTAGKWGYVGCKYNSAASTWHVLAVNTEA